ncbi:MAG: hypothetical protein JWR88_1907 [Pseudonocardia sp.]|nr:hypothetical protein [Pseudonocardia sp.]
MSWWLWAIVAVVVVVVIVAIIERRGISESIRRRRM